MIGYYVHHQGMGHLTRARCVAASSGYPVTALTSLPAPVDPSPFADWVVLPRDDAPGDEGVDPTVDGALHWAPRSAHGYAARMAALAAWVGAARPAAVVVDVSVEVTALVRLLGVPVVVVAGPGVRDDRAHDLAHRAATRILAPWPAEAMDPAHLHPWAGKVVHTGAFSRFDDRARPPREGAREVLVLLGRGDTDAGHLDLDAARRATPGWRWSTAGPDCWAEDDEVWRLLTGSDVVVCHAGQNVVAETAAARRPAVVVAHRRPFDEQVATASALRRTGIAVGLAERPDPADWSDLLTRATTLGGAGWSRWNPGDGAARAAAVVDRVAAG